MDHRQNNPPFRINRKLIPRTSYWKDKAKAEACGQKVGNIYVSRDKLVAPFSVTMHNTPTFKYLSDPEQNAQEYVKQTFYENMKSSRVHFYISGTQIWQELDTDYRSWHAGDGNNGMGNSTSVSIEMIEDLDSPKKYKDLTEAVGMIVARYVMWLKKTKLVYPHHHWASKYCPQVILTENRWDKFVNDLMADCPTDYKQTASVAL
jgi:N-acetylmuramoyl-L-alanine amidase